ncbi:hypothetical protein [Streptomyces sp. CBMA152]|uniref:hypothetical protein n=1 Tax=Streptomyces sp. CBMA152 TaxID=1896312 RepID=UPI001660FAD6|nr:hypothetical protein [Streptomyces sp. CBMA152]MBD0741681.1 hypothetical protein [Streptomyces sp. CBMA152]
MHHPSRTAHRRSACTRPAGCSPLRVLEESFLALASTVEPLTLPAHLVCAEPEHPVLPVDQVRTLLAHPATPAVLREQTWREVVRRAQQLGDPWNTVAVAMTVPVLRRMLARLVRPAHLERAEVEQEALAAVATALTSLDTGTADVGRELFAAADRAVHRLAYAAHRRAERERGPVTAHLGRLAQPVARAVCQDAADVVEDQDGGKGDEYAVLARAVQAQVVNVTEARLIARTRLEGEPMQLLAAERGVSVRQLYRHRSAAEQHLAAHLRQRLLDQ